jgi:hypothetical protein
MNLRDLLATLSVLLLAAFAVSGFLAALGRLPSWVPVALWFAYIAALAGLWRLRKRH